MPSPFVQTPGLPSLASGELAAYFAASLTSETVSLYRLRRVAPGQFRVDKVGEANSPGSIAFFSLYGAVYLVEFNADTSLNAWRVNIGSSYPEIIDLLAVPDAGGGVGLFVDRVTQELWVRNSSAVFHNPQTGQSISSGDLPGSPKTIYNGVAISYSGGSARATRLATLTSGPPVSDALFDTLLSDFSTYAVLSDAGGVAEFAIRVSLDTAGQIIVRRATLDQNTLTLSSTFDVPTGQINAAYAGASFPANTTAYFNDSFSAIFFGRFIPPSSFLDYSFIISNDGLFQQQVDPYITYAAQSLELFERDDWFGAISNNYTFDGVERALFLDKDGAHQPYSTALVNPTYDLIVEDIVSGALNVEPFFFYGSVAPVSPFVPFWTAYNRTRERSFA